MCRIALARVALAAFTLQVAVSAGPRIPEPSHSRGLESSTPNGPASSGSQAPAVAGPRFTPLQPDLLGAGGTLVNAFADFDGDGDLDLFVGFDGAPNRLYRNDAGRFTDVAVTAGVADARATRAAAWGDYDGDGDADLLVGFAPLPPARALAPSAAPPGSASSASSAAPPGPASSAPSAAPPGSASSVPSAAPLGSASSASSAAPLGSASSASSVAPSGSASSVAPASVLRLYKNDAGHFSDQTVAAGLTVAVGAVRQPVFVDMDGDGDLDLFIAFRDRANALYRNDGGRFTDIAASVGLADTRKSVGAVWFDYDEDGDLDVAVANMDGDANALYRNDAGRFTDVAVAAGVEWGGRHAKDPNNGTVRVCAADMDGDGHVDLVAANYGPLGFFSNRGRGLFEDRAAAWGLAMDSRYDTCAPADIDHDGRLDLYVNGTVTGGASWQDVLLRNTGSAFADVTPPNVRALQADHGVQWADIDGDGDLDLALTGSRPDGMHLVLRNELDPAAARRSLQVRVLDARGRATLAGAEVRVFAAGTTRLMGTRLVDSGSGYDAQSDMPVHVGLPEGVDRVDVQVIVPRHGTRQATWVRGVDPRARVGKALVVRVARAVR